MLKNLSTNTAHLTNKDLSFLEKNFPLLKVTTTNNKTIIKGNIVFYACYNQETKQLDQGDLPEQAKKSPLYISDGYEIEIILIRNNSSFVVKEIGKKIERSGDFHVNPDGSLCLFAPPDFFNVFPNGLNIKDLIQNGIIPFLYAQSYFKKEKKWLWGDRSHGNQGTLESLRDNFSDITVLPYNKLLKFLNNKTPMKGHTLCLCGSQKKIRECHNNLIQTLKKLKIIYTNENLNIPLKNLYQSKNILDIIIQKYVANRKN